MPKLPEFDLKAKSFGAVGAQKTVERLFVRNNVKRIWQFFQSNHMFVAFAMKLKAFRINNESSNCDSIDDCQREHIDRLNKIVVVRFWYLSFA